MILGLDGRSIDRIEKIGTYSDHDEYKIVFTDDSYFAFSIQHGSPAAVPVITLTDIENGKRVTITSGSQSSSVDIPYSVIDIDDTRSDLNNVFSARHVQNLVNAIQSAAQLATQKSNTAESSISTINTTLGTINTTLSAKANSADVYDKDEIDNKLDILRDAIIEDVPDEVDRYVAEHASELKGPSGANGSSGESAYEVAVRNGFSGSEGDFIESLKGRNGTDGTNGRDGVDGTNGKSAYEIAVQNGYTGTSSEWLLSLKGDKGDQGEQGIQGIQGERGEKGEQGERGEDATVPDAVTHTELREFNYDDLGRDTFTVLASEYSSSYPYIKLFDLKPIDSNKPMVVGFHMETACAAEPRVNSVRDCELTFAWDGDKSYIDLIAYRFSYSASSTSFRDFLGLSNGKHKPQEGAEYVIPVGVYLDSGLYGYNTVDRTPTITITKLVNCTYEFPESHPRLNSTQFLNNNASAYLSTIKNTYQFGNIGISQTGDSDTVNRTDGSYVSPSISDYPMYRYRFFCMKLDGTAAPLTITNKTSSSDGVVAPNMTTKFSLGGEIYWYGIIGTVAIGSRPTNYTVHVVNMGGVDPRYGFSVVGGKVSINGEALNYDDTTANSLPLYVKALDNGDGTWSLDSTLGNTDISYHLATALPTTDDGHIYIKFADFRKTNSIVVTPRHPIYRWNGSAYTPYGMGGSASGNQTSVITPTYPVAINVATFNIAGYGTGNYNGNGTDAQIVDYMRLFASMDADVIGLQEDKQKYNASSNTDDVLYKKFYQYRYRATGSGVPSILSRYSMSNTRTTKYTDESAYMYVEGTININGIDITIISTHTSYRPTSQVDVCHDELIAHLATLQNFILMGDMNPWGNDHHYWDTIYKKYSDAGYNVASCGVWNPLLTVQSGSDYNNIYVPCDNIITSPNIKIIDAKTIDTTLSDHKPIVAKLLITTDETATPILPTTSEETTTSYTLTFDVDGGSSISSVTQASGSVI